EQSMTVCEYLELYRASDDAKTKLLSESFETIGRDSKVPNAVAATWIISFDQINKSCPRAAEMLSLMAFLDCQSIPKPLLQRECDEPFEIIKALGTLKAFSLVIETGGDTFNMHRLVQLVMRKWLAVNGELQRRAGQALATVANLYPNGNFE